MSSYAQARDEAMGDPEAFWLRESARIDWVSRPPLLSTIGEAPLYRWFPDGVLNTSANALDRHVAAGRGDRVAIYYDSPVTGTKSAITYADLLDRGGQVRRRARDGGRRIRRPRHRVHADDPGGRRRDAGLRPTRRGPLGGLRRVRACRARRPDRRCDTPGDRDTASCGIEPSRVIEYKPLLDEALHLAHHEPAATDRAAAARRRVAAMGDRDVDWERAMATASPRAAVPVLATDPLYILYTSGTTGKPKGVVRDNGGHAVAMAWSFDNVYGMGPDDVWWAASDVGWVVGHSYIVYAPLIAGAATVLYEGKPVGTPDAGAFWRVIGEYGVSALFTAPTAIRAIKKEDPDGTLIAGYDLSSLRALFLAGERLDPDTYHWADRAPGRPRRSTTGGRRRPAGRSRPTCAAWSRCRSSRDRPASPSPATTCGSSTARAPNCRRGTTAPSSSACRCPPGTLPTLWGDDQRYIDSYLRTFDGYYTTGDGGFVDDEGYVYVMGRTDDVINVAGHRLSTGSMEAVVAAHPMVAECAVIGVHDELKGQVPAGVRGPQGRGGYRPRSAAARDRGRRSGTRSGRWPR